METKAKDATTIGLLTDRPIVLRRRFDAPRELVWEAWTCPDHIGRWWSGEAQPLPFCEVDLRVGGGFRWVSHSSDGREWSVKGTYQEILSHEKIVCTQIFDLEAYSTEYATTTATFTLIDGLTEIDYRIDLPLTAATVGIESGMKGAFDRLDEHMAKELEKRWA